MKKNHETIGEALIALYKDGKILWGEYCYLNKLLKEKIAAVCNAAKEQMETSSNDNT